MSIENNPKITKKNFTESPLNIHTFNQEFIAENVVFDGVVNSIVSIGKESIENKERVKTLKNKNEKK